MIKNIIFDIGGVLADFVPKKVMKEMGLSESDVEELAYKTVLGPLWIELDRGVLSKEEVFAKMMSNLPERLKESAEKFLNKEIEKAVISFPYAKNLVSNLKERGYKIYLLTNYPDWLFDFHWEKSFTFTESIDGSVVSGKVKKVKPDEEIYKYLLEKFNLIADECVFLDDREENILGAEKCGIHGIHFSSFEKATEKLEEILSN